MGIEPTSTYVITSLHPATAGLRRCSGGVGLHRNLCPYQGENQPILLPLSLQPIGWMVERVVLPEERYRSTAPYGYR
jgi:hypothetical protein